MGFDFRVCWWCVGFFAMLLVLSFCFELVLVGLDCVFFFHVLASYVYIFVSCGFL